jgi:ABC-type polysaccharide/polyol phosphate export permease
MLSSIDNTLIRPETVDHPPIQEKKWLLEIKPEVPWYELQLKDLWRYRDLIGMFIYREFVAQYKQTILGPLWFLIQPILTTLMFVVVFGRVAKISTDGMPQILFYMAGLLLWNYFSACFTKVSETFSSNASIFGKVYFPRMVVPIATVIQFWNSVCSSRCHMDILLPARNFYFPEFPYVTYSLSGTINGCSWFRDRYHYLLPDN